MQTKHADGSVEIAGMVSRDATTMYSAAKGTPVTKFGVMVGKRKDTTTIFVDCTAFNDLAEQLKGLRKKDTFHGVGRIESRDYNGKTYTDLILEYGNSPALCGQARPAAPVPQSVQKEDTGTDIPEGFSDITDSDSELPF